MKTLLFILILFSLHAKSQNTGMGTYYPDPSARLDIYDTTRGVLLPRLTIAQMQAIQNPANSLLLYNTTTQSYWYFNSVWRELVQANTPTVQFGNCINPSRDGIICLDTIPNVKVYISAGGKYYKL